MSPEKSPAFQFYPKDFLTDERVRLMCHTERGVYITLLCLCWLEHSLPQDLTVLARLVDIPALRFQKLWKNQLVHCFRIGDDDRLHHKRLDEERAKQDHFRRRQGDNGSKGGRPKKPTENPEPEKVETQKNPSLSGSGFPNKSSPISDLRSPVSDLQTAVSARAICEEDIGDRARELLEHYPEWFQRWRNGARTRVIHNTLEFQDACDLCRHWDDARLPKLAKIVLTTDDPYISGTDRGFKIFAMKASWADDRLRQWEVEHGVAV